MNTILARFYFAVLLVALQFAPASRVTAASIDSITVINLPTNDLQLDATRNLLYATVPSRGGVGVGNTVTRIGLDSKSILDSTFIGSEPGVMTLATDGSQLYVNNAGSYSIRAFNPATLTAGPQTQVANNYHIGDLAAVPGQPGTFVGSVLRDGSPQYVGIGVWHFNGSTFSTNGPVGIGAGNFAYSDDPTIFYATSGATLAKVTLGPGDSLVAQYGPPLGAADPDIALGGNLLVSGPGRATDTTTFTPAGLFAGDSWTAVAVDPVLEKVFLTHGQAIDVFDMNTFIKVATLAIPEVGPGTSYRMLRYGTNGLALTTDQDQVILLEFSAVPEPSSLVIAGVGMVSLLSFLASRRRST